MWGWVGVCVATKSGTTRAAVLPRSYYHLTIQAQSLLECRCLRRASTATCGYPVDLKFEIDDRDSPITRARISTSGIADGLTGLTSSELMTADPWK